jgi:catechol 2,3-dioxygenase-like lactoylglutathione lyase family enzyme
MKIEHFALSVKDPVAVAAWYVKHLGMQVKREFKAPVPCYFLADSTGDVMIEIYNNPQCTPPDYRTVDPLLVHLAFSSPDVEAEVQRLLAAGATLAGERIKGEDTIQMLRDPWGFPIQFVKRGRPML